MSIARAFGFGNRSRRNASPDARGKLPEVNSFVEISIGGSSARESLPVNEISATHIVTRLGAGMVVGAVADFLYITSQGRFRMLTVCSQTDAEQAFFDLPTDIKTIEAFAQRRSDVRVPCVIPVQWRYAPGGRGNGNYLPGSMKDLSRGGTSLVVGAALKVGAQVEARFTLKTKGAPVVQVCEVVRATKIELSDKNMFGARFVEIDVDDADMLDTFVHERQTQRRNRGIV
jgi:hypothetical protein